MSDLGLVFPSIPVDTARAAEAVLETKSPYRRLGDELEVLFASCRLHLCDAQFAGGPILFMRRTLATLFQATEWLTDRQAVEAMHTRVAWKYALHLPLNHPGFQAPTFCQFRQQLLADEAAWKMFQTVLSHVVVRHLWSSREADPDQAEQLLAQLCRLNQTVLIAEALAQALEVLAVLRPDWLRQKALPHWYVRYAVGKTGVARPPSHGEGNLLPEAIRADITYLLEALAHGEVAELAQLPEIRHLRRAWQQHCDFCQKRNYRCLSCSNCIVSASITNELFLS